MGKPRKAPRRITRDLVLRIFGLAGITYETLYEKVDRPALLAVFAGMVGLPIFMNRDSNGADNSPRNNDVDDSKEDHDDR